MSTQVVRYPPVVTTFSVTATNPSVGTTGAAAPTSATEVGMVDGTGKLQGVSSTNPLPVTGTVTASNPSVSSTGSAVPASGTYVGMNVGGNLTGLTGTANGLKVDGSAVTQPVSAASLPLPTGAATSAKQPALGTAGSASTDVITVQGIASMTALKVDGSAVTQPVSAASLPLPTGAATSANQTTGNTSLASIDGKLASLGQKTMAGSEPVVIASDQSAIPTAAPINSNGSASSTTVSTAATITKPANAVGFILQNDAASTDYIRWCDANSTASTTVGSVLQPGQDTGYVPMSKNLSVCAHSGTQNYNIQWVLSS